MKRFYSLAFAVLLALLALSSTASAKVDESLLNPDVQEEPTAPAFAPDASDDADALLPIRPSNSDEKVEVATCASAKSCGHCLSGSFGNCGWCGEHGNEGNCYECVLVEGKCVGSNQQCSRSWNARVCPSNHHSGRDFVLSVGAIIGISVGGAAACAVAFCACCCFICFRRRRYHRHEELGHHHHHDAHGYVLV